MTLEDKEQCKTLGKTPWRWKEVLISTLPLKLRHKKHDAAYNLSPQLEKCVHHRAFIVQLLRVREVLEFV